MARQEWAPCTCQNPAMKHTTNNIESAQYAVPRMVQPLSKGLGPMKQPLSAAEIAGLGWNLLNEDLSLPAAVLYEEKLAHNLQWMQAFAKNYGVKLAPHGKTTMAPRLFARQLEAGAWGITLATAHQTQVAYEYGIRRVLMANQLVGRQNMSVIASLLENPQFEFFCLVDSDQLVEMLGRFFQSRSQRLNVLLELGVNGGRTGVRDKQQLTKTLNALFHWREHVALAGIEVYEGILQDESSIREFLQRAVNAAGDLAREKRYARSPAILSGAGSAWYDVVADVFSKANLGEAFEILLRPGCYLTHDVGIYRAAQQQIMLRNPVASSMESTLVPALQIWAYVQSIPEKEKAIISLGKRDAAFDVGLPLPALHYRPGNSAPLVAPGFWKLTRLMDQHAYLQIESGADIRVGDMIAFDISHPCLTFDKWRYLAVMNSEFRVVDVVETFF
jgi:D-serine dehydratase